MAELSMLVKVTVVLLVGLAGTWLGSRLSAAVRSLILASVFGLLLALPIASLMLPARAFEVPVAGSLPLAPEPVGPVASLPGSSVAVAIAPSTTSHFGMPSTQTSLLLLWAVGATAFMTPLVTGLLGIRRLRACGRPWANASLPSSVDVVLHDQLRVPVTCGVRRPLIALPADAPQWTESDLRRVLLHELEHVRRRDWAVHVIARAITAVYWFHPLVWIAWRRLCLESERACDDAVLREEDGTAYAEQLISLARRITKHEALPLLSIAGR